MQKIRVLAFEDGYDIEALLLSSGIDLSNFELLQHWNSTDFLAIIEKFSPAILLLDHFMPPTRGFDVLMALNAAVESGEIQRPSKVIAMSSEERANDKMLEIGADQAVIKFDLAKLSFWTKSSS